MTSNAQETITLVEDLYTSRYPRGWFCLGFSNELGIGKIKSVDAFGAKLVMFRGEDGTARVLDGYCPHMGAELSIGCVKGNNIQCAFHHWEYGGDGKCKHIPYANKIPDKAKVKPWRVEEKNQLIMVWHDADGGVPDFELPRIEGAYSDEWTDWMCRDIYLDIHPREIVDNLADKAHFGPVHKSPLSGFELNLKGHIGEQITIVNSEILGEMRFNATYYGPAFQVGRYRSVDQGIEMNAVMLNAHTPIDQNSCILHWGLIVEKRSNGELIDETYLEDYMERNIGTFMMDVRIWKNKRFEYNPVLCDGDGPLNKMRKWYNQFYLPKN